MCVRDPGARPPAAATAALAHAFSRGAGPADSDSASTGASSDGEEEVAGGSGGAAARAARREPTPEPGTPRVTARAPPDADGLAAEASSAAPGAASTAAPAAPPPPADAAAARRDRPPPLPDVAVSRFMPTARRIVQFSSGTRPPPSGRIAYIDGAFDLFHVGHVEILKAARAQADFLLVGVHGDEEVAARRGPHRPVLSLHERALSVLACRSADEVIIGAPAVVTEDLLTTFGVTLVVRGTVHESAPGGPGVVAGGAGASGAGGAGGGAAGAPPRLSEDEERRYAVPRARGVLRALPSPSAMTSATLITRIVANREAFEARQAAKGAAEAAYYCGAKAYVEEV
jgi:cytidyltransferase-like protein